MFSSLFTVVMVLLPVTPQLNVALHPNGFRDQGKQWDRKKCFAVLHIHEAFEDLVILVARAESSGGS